MVASGLVLLALGLASHAVISADDAFTLSPQDSAFCPVELAALHESAEEGMSAELTPISKVIQIYGIAPGYELVPVGVMLNFEDSSSWFGKQQPFETILKWGMGGFRKEADGSTKLTGLIVPIGGTIANFELMEGKMTPLNTPWAGALETGSLVIKPVDINNPNEWVYVYSSYAPEDWNCDAGIIFP